MDQPETNDTAAPPIEPGHVMSPEAWARIQAEMAETQK